MFCDKINQQVPLLSEKSNPTVAFNLQKYFEFTYNKYKKKGGMLSEEEFEELMKDQTIVRDLRHRLTKRRRE